MSLITLTFRNGPIEEYQLGLKGYKFTNEFAQGEQVSSNGKVRIIKTVKFFGTDNLCIIGELVDGSVSLAMSAEVLGKKAFIAEVESKYCKGNTVAKKGAKLTLMLSGVEEKDFEGIQELEFLPPLREAKERPIGKLIIC